MTEEQRLKRNETVRRYRKKTGNRATRKYERTKRGFLMRKYRNMQSRVVGIQKKKAHLYKGKCLLERDEYYKWAFDSREFNRLYEEWVKSEYDRKLCPTVDRINPDEGYCLENMRWITHSENSRLGAVARNKK